MSVFIDANTFNNNIQCGSLMSGSNFSVFPARFSSPQLQREDAEVEGGETAFLCHSSGGFPEPRVHWLINDSDAPPEGSVRTVAESLPDSYLYNITSHLTVNISSSTRVSCTIENLSTMERETATSCE